MFFFFIVGLQLQQRLEQFQSKPVGSGNWKNLLPKALNCRVQKHYSSTFLRYAKFWLNIEREKYFCDKSKKILISYFLSNPEDFCIDFDYYV